VGQLLKDREKLREEVKVYDQSIAELEKRNENELKDLRLKQQATLGNLRSDIDGLDSDLYNHAEDVKRQKSVEEALQKLKFDIKNEKKLQMIEINEKEREKIQAIAKLRKEMQYKIKETKANLLALNDEQLQTTTRLTILQNHQLTSELEHQSQQTEELLFKNNKMRSQIEKIRRDIQIHKDVEKELAKRSHFCQKVIKKLKVSVENLESRKKAENLTDGGGQVQTVPPSVLQQQNDEEMINFLEQKLEQIEKQLKQTQQHYEQL